MGRASARMWVAVGKGITGPPVLNTSADVDTEPVIGGPARSAGRTCPYPLEKCPYPPRQIGLAEIRAEKELRIPDVDVSVGDGAPRGSNGSADVR